MWEAPLKQYSENGRNQFRVALQYLLGAALQLRFWLHWQRQQGEPWIEINLLAQLLKAQPDHPINKRLQLLRQKGWAKLEAPVRHHHDHRQMQHLGVELQKASGLGKQAVHEPRLGVHLHLQQHHGPIRRTNIPRAGPERPIKTMARRFELRSLKAIELIARRIWPERGSLSGTMRQEQGDQIRRTLKEPVEPVIGFQTPAADTGQTPIPITPQYACTAAQGFRVFTGFPAKRLRRAPAPHTTWLTEAPRPIA